jgi:outer membrane receptor protein involved in Fe transport
VNWDIPYVADRKLKLGASFRWHDVLSVTPQFISVADTTNGRKATAPARLETPGYTVANLHVGWHGLADRRATLWFDLYNAFDRRYYAAGGAGSRTFFNMPQQPRTWTVSLEYRF